MIIPAKFMIIYAHKDNNSTFQAPIERVLGWQSSVPQSI